MILKASDRKLNQTIVALNLNASQTTLQVVHSSEMLPDGQDTYNGFAKCTRNLRIDMFSFLDRSLLLVYMYKVLS